MSTTEAGRTECEREANSRSSVQQREHESLEVAQHYEHDAAVFNLVLDSRLAYSTGIYDEGVDDLEEAQRHKCAYVQRQLDIAPGANVLDVGCGWGSIMLHLAEQTEARFRGITLSAAQRDEALKRARERGVADRVEVDLCHVEEFEAEPHSFDAAIFSGSIVHMHNREAVHRIVGKLIRPGGRVLISDCFFPVQVRGNRESEATQYIFVKALGYCRLLGLSEELQLLEKSGFDIERVDDLTASYVRTLNAWIGNIRINRKAIEEIAPGFARVLQSYMTVAKMSFARRTALEYMITAVKSEYELREESVA